VKNFSQNLGLCRKAGALAIGFDAAVAAMKHQKAAGVLTASDISAKTLKEVQFHADKYKAKVINLAATREDIGSIIGISAAVVAVMDKSLFTLFNKLGET
jgi:ribosomal protein L7Ae-like RNA K-turn-binding protein